MQTEVVAWLGKFLTLTLSLHLAAFGMNIGKVTEDKMLPFDLSLSYLHGQMIAELFFFGLPLLEWQELGLEEHGQQSAGEFYSEACGRGGGASVCDHSRV